MKDFPPANPPARHRIAVTALFFFNGMMFATWASRIPAIQEKHGLTHGTLGLALLVLAAGALVAMPISGMLSAKIGKARLIHGIAIFFGASLPVLAWTPNAAWLFPVLFWFGAGHGALDVAMNAHAVDLEKGFRRPIMSSFHALWSTGSLIGALLGGLLASLGWAPGLHFSLMFLLAVASACWMFPNLPDFDRTPAPGNETGSFSLRLLLFNRQLLALGVISFCAMLSEGAIADWSAVYLRSVIETNEGLAAAGFGTFSVTMALGRFLGDALAARLGPAMLVRFGGLLWMAGIGLVIGFDFKWVTLTGFAIVGLGLSTMIPMVFSAAGRVQGVPPGLALASVTSLGYLGFLMGPPVIGFTAEWIHLRAALGLLIGTGLLTMLLSAFVRNK